MRDYLIKKNIERSYAYTMGDHLNDFIISLWVLDLSDTIPDSIWTYRVAKKYE